MSRGLLGRALAAAAVAFAWAATPAQAAPFVYATEIDSGPQEVLQYAAGAGGLLAPLSPPVVPVDHFQAGIAVSPDGRSVYVANTSSVSQWDIGADGALSPKNPPAVPMSGRGDGLAVSPDGRSLYVASGQVAQYDIGAGGALTPKSPPAVGLGSGSLAVSPDGRSVYATIYDPFSRGDGTIFQYDVGAGGALAPKDPAEVSTWPGPFGIAVSPDGKSVYVADCHLNAPRGVSQFDVGADGALSPKSPAVLLDTPGSGNCPFEVAVAPDGRSVYVSAYSPNGVVIQYDVGSDGALSPKSPATVPAAEARGLAVSPDGRSLYVAGSSLFQFDIGADGALTPKSTPAVPAGDGAYGIAVSPAPPLPTTLRECRNGGWKQFGFENQGRCVAFVVLTRICDALERQGVHLKFCPPTPPNPLLEPSQ